MLYEPWTGVPPHGRDASGFLGGIDELRRCVLEVEPRRPSLVVGPAVAPVTAREVRGELDWIVMRCLEKEPARRYDSVSVLANDVLRHLAGDPVLAGPPTLGYRVGKFVRRHATALVALLAVFAGLVVAVVTIEGEARRANAARIEADASAADARAELVRADAVAVFLEDVLMSLDPAVAEGEDPTMVLAMLARAERRLADDADGLPAVAADLHRIVGQRTQAGALLLEALPHLETAYDLAARGVRRRGLRTIGSALELAAALAEPSRTDEAIDLLERQLPLARRVLGAEDDLALQLLGNLGATLHLAGRDDEAEPILRELEEVRLRTAGADDATTILASNNLADVLTSLGRHDEAAPRYEEAYDFQLRTKGPRDPLTLTALNNLASCLQEAGDLERAGAMLERALDVKREILPPGHPSLVVGLNNLASLMERVERTDRADELRREAIDVGRAGQGLDSRTTLVAIYNHAQSLAQRGDDDAAREAEGLLDEFLGHAPTVFGDPSPIVVGARGLLADAKLELGDLEEAEVLARSASETVPAVFPPGDPAFVVFGARLATIRLARGEGDVDAILAELERRHAELVALGFTSSARHVAGTLESWYRSNGDAERADRWARESEG
ncbi:MAG: tetratricopeptide repeat protein [Planctomycetota bacterium]